MNIDKVVTLEDIQLLIEDAHKAPINENGSSDMWDMLPRIPYKYLPDELKQVADKITVELAKKFLYECYPVGHFDKEAADPQLIQQALHNARYLVESTDLTPPEKTCNANVDKAIYDGWQPVSLIGSDLVEAWEKTIKGKTAKKSAEKKSMSANARLAIARGLAEERGAIITTDGHVSSFSSDLFVNAFTSKNIYKLPDGTDKNKVFDNNGLLNTLAQPTDELQSLEEIHTAFLMTACEYVRLTEDDGSHTFKMYLPGLDLDGRTHSKERSKNTPAVRSEARINYIKNAAAPFDPLVGYTPNGSFYRVLALLEYDAESETATFAAPYIFKIKEMAEDERPHHSAYNKLFHADIINEPNKAAVELANRLLNGVLRLGNTPDVQRNKKRFMREHERQISLFDNEDMAAMGVDNKKITYRIKYTSLLEDCPQLTHILQEILDSDSKTKYQAYNSKLKQTFEQAYRIIMEKSDAPTYYEKFTLPGKYDKKGKLLKYITPTKSTLNSTLIIKHYGKRNAAS